jgi:hypothetical protein
MSVCETMIASHFSLLDDRDEIFAVASPFLFPAIAVNKQQKS